MVRSSVGRALAVLLGIVAILALVVGAYNVRVSAGVASAGAGAAASPHAWGYAFAGGYGFPWFFFWPTFPILFIVLVALVVRAAVWGGSHGGRGPWGGPGRGGVGDRHDFPTDDGPSARFEDWHRRAHAGEGPGTAAPAGDHAGQA